MLFRKFVALMLILIIFIPFCFVEAAGENIAFQETVFENGENPWGVFGTGEVGIEQLKTNDGKTELVLKATGLGENTWSSPKFDMFKAIKADVEKNGAGRYAISFNVMLEGEKDKEYDVSVLVRSSNKTALFKNGNGGEAGFRATLGSIKDVSDKWKSFSTTFGVSKEDIEGEQSWNLCLDHITKGLHTVWLSDFSIIRVSDDATPEVKNVLCVDCTKYLPMEDSGEKTQEETTAEKKENLLKGATSTFDDITDLKQSGWTGLSAGIMSLTKEGYSGGCLKMETPPNTWGSPVLDIFPYIKEPGKYSVSMMVKYDGDGEKDMALIIRGSRKNSFIEQHNTNFYTDIGTKRVKAGEWTRIMATFTVAKEDILENDSWRLCFSSIAADVKALYIDEVALVNGGVANLPAVAEPNESVQIEQAKREEEQLPPLYDENIKKTAISTAIRTLIVVVVVILLKIFLPKVFKKGVKK